MTAAKYGAQDGDAEQRSRQTLVGRALYWVLWRVFYAAILVMFRLRVEGRENIPDGPFILSGIHRSFIDTPIIGMVTSRRLRFMGKESLWKSKPLGAFLTVMGGFPVERGTADRTALRAAEDVLSLGEPLVMFPEGTRQEGDRIDREQMLDGPSFVSARSGVPIVPVGIGGSAKALPLGAKIPRPRKIVAVIGDPIYPPARGEGRVPRRVVTDLTDRLTDELGDLYIEARVLAGDEPPPAG
ncbi:MAG: lysophospholipid acyltransferase family protein [Actinomycetota bacterium]